MIPWHRLFGLSLIDFFYGTFYNVELERDLSRRQKYVDILIVRKKTGDKPEELPDGLDNLAAYNLISYKSHQESLRGWTIEELEGYFADYRKDISPSLKTLIPRDHFQLYAVSTRFPKKLAGQIKFRDVKQGVFDVKWGIRDIRVIVLSRIKKSKRNALWLMFSAVPEKVKYGAKQYTWKTHVSGILNRLFKKYNIEGVVMPYTMEDYFKETREEVLGSLTEKDIDRILKGLRPEDRLKGLRPEDRLKGLKPEEIEAYLKKIKQKG